METIADKKEPIAYVRFLAELKETGMVRHSARVAGKNCSTFYRRRRTDPGFAAAWDAAVAAFGKAREATLAPPPGLAALPPAASNRARRTAFLDTLAETSSVTIARQRAGFTHTEVYKLRRHDPRFAAAWRLALIEGYDQLEFELLAHLRDPRSPHKMDVSGALRLLAAHRETMARERALLGHDDKEAVLASVDRFFEGLRERRLANAALLVEQREPAGTEGEVVAASAMEPSDAAD